MEIFGFSAGGQVNNIKTEYQIIIRPNDAYRWVVRESPDLDEVVFLEYQLRNDNGIFLTQSDMPFVSTQEIDAVAKALEIVLTGVQHAS
jgi:hypothetical protein